MPNPPSINEDYRLHKKQPKKAHRKVYRSSDHNGERQQRGAEHANDNVHHNSFSRSKASGGQPSSANSRKKKKRKRKNYASAAAGAGPGHYNTNNNFNHIINNNNYNNDNSIYADGASSPIVDEDNELLGGSDTTAADHAINNIILNYNYANKPQQHSRDDNGAAAAKSLPAPGQDSTNLTLWVFRLTRPLNSSILVDKVSEKGAYVATLPDIFFDQRPEDGGHRPQFLL